MDSKDHRRTIDVCTEIEQERFRQIKKEGFEPFKDDRFAQEELATAAVIYAVPGSLEWRSFADKRWPWHRLWLKRTTRRRDLIKAAALLVAEIERLDRASEKEQG